MKIAGLVAYPGKPIDIGRTISAALTALRKRGGASELISWEETDVAGRFLVEPILANIDAGNLMVADVTQLNFNVTFEVGYAIGRRKRVVLIRHEAIKGSDDIIRETGLFDTLGYTRYRAAEQLTEILADLTDLTPLPLDDALNTRAPVYVVLPRVKTDAEVRLLSRVKKAGLNFRSFDPEERGRLAAREAIDNVAQSLGVVSILLPEHRVDAPTHNARAAFVAGLSLALRKPLLLLQDGDEPVPLDYRDLVTPFRFPDQIDQALATFAPEVAAGFQTAAENVVAEPATFLTRLNLGASAAENELAELGHYYLETDEFRRALRGEVRIVAGRKGAGKTALFVQLRNRLRQSQDHVILDLKPEGFQLLKFKQRVLDYLEAGTKEHTITAFWEYLLLLETCHKILANDQQLHMRNDRLYEPYRRLASAYYADDYVIEGDFAERMLMLTQRIADDFEASKRRAEPGRLTTGEITEVLYKHDVSTLRERVVEYLSHKESLWILFDNLDKGWPAHGLGDDDVLTLRALIDAMGKIERQLARQKVEAHGVVFIRNDVYELLIAATPDRGKIPQITLDWTDPALLKELLRRRFTYAALRPSLTFDEVWRQICVSHYRGEETSQYLMERCLMRPRSLIELLGYCRSHAVNLRHDRIEDADIEAGEEGYSSDQLNNINFEIRDVFPAAADVLYDFIESPALLSLQQVRDLLVRRVGEGTWEKLLELLLWYGFLGIVRDGGEATYIYHVRYDIKRLQGLLGKADDGRKVFAINAAFWRALEARS